MSKQFVQIIQAMTVLHEKFNKSAKEKLTVIKEGDMTALERIMKDESVLIQQLHKLEATRLHEVEVLAAGKGLVKEDVTIETLLPFFSEGERKEVEHWQDRLLSEIMELKQQNDLNQQLLEESLRFVNMSLDAMQPQSQFENYQVPNMKNKENTDTKHSLFDSKA